MSIANNKPAALAAIMERWLTEGQENTLEETQEATTQETIATEGEEEPVATEAEEELVLEPT